MSAVNRPLSPHLGIYRKQLTSVLSITHRATGVALAAGLLLLVYWLSALAAGPEAYAGAQSLVGSFLGRAVLFAFTLALFYHLCNGIRHLFWDVGLGFELTSVYRSGWTVVVARLRRWRSPPSRTKRICLPSGDHRGERSAAFASARSTRRLALGAWASESTVRRFPSSEKASVLPSGDQVGEVAPASTVGMFVRSRSRSRTRIPPP